MQGFVSLTRLSDDRSDPITLASCRADNTHVFVSAALGLLALTSFIVLKLAIVPGGKHGQFQGAVGNMRVPPWFFAMILLAALWLLAACEPVGPTPTATSEETSLPFEIIEQSDFGPIYTTYQNDTQRMFLIRSTDEALRFSGGSISEEAKNALAQLDYDRYFAIALFRGRFLSSGYDAIIQRVGRRNGELVVHVQFWEPAPYYGVAALETSPYHIIKVMRDDEAIEGVSLILESQTVTPTPPVEIRRLTPGFTP